MTSGPAGPWASGPAAATQGSCEPHGAPPRGAPAARSRSGISSSVSSTCDERSPAASPPPRPRSLPNALEAAPTSTRLLSPGGETRGGRCGAASSPPPAPTSSARPKLRPPLLPGPEQRPPPVWPAQVSPGTRRTGVSAHPGVRASSWCTWRWGGELIFPEGTRRPQAIHSASCPWLKGEGHRVPLLLSGGLGDGSRARGRESCPLRATATTEGCCGEHPAPTLGLGSSRLSRQLTYEDFVHFLTLLWSVSVCWHQARSKVPRVPR